jgi:retron-type reverse transcriptase
MFGYSPRFVGALYKRTERYYRTFSIPKGKGKRIIHAPRVSLKVIQKWFGHHLADAIDFSENVYGFVRGRSAVKAAAFHCGVKWIYSADIKDFFQTTPTASVVNNLISVGYPDHGAELIGKLCSYKGFLAQGSPASPVLSNLVFRATDSSLAELAQEFGIRYTRYADDIVFSGTDDFPRELVGRVKGIVESGGWKLAAEKERLLERPKRLKVHGLLVHGERPRLSKGYRNRIRAFRHLLEAKKVAESDISRIKGHIAYAKSVEVIK